MVSTPDLACCRLSASICSLLFVEIRSGVVFMHRLIIPLRSSSLHRIMSPCRESSESGGVLWVERLSEFDFPKQRVQSRIDLRLRTGRVCAFVPQSAPVPSRSLSSLLSLRSSTVGEQNLVPRSCSSCGGPRIVFAVALRLHELLEVLRSVIVGADDDALLDLSEDALL